VNTALYLESESGWLLRCGDYKGKTNALRFTARLKSTRTNDTNKSETFLSILHETDIRSDKALDIDSKIRRFESFHPVPF
jgi:hypothetical protein